MKKNVIITIGRQFGSGGHEVGKRLSDRLGIPLYDRNLIQMATKEMGLLPDQSDEGQLSKEVFQIQSDLIRKLADKEPCIIIGRCADYILEGRHTCLNAFVYAEIRDRIHRIMRIYNLNEEEAWEKIKKTDAERKEYYEKHTGNTWGSIESHQMLFNVSLMDIHDVVDTLAAMYRARR